MASTAFVAPLVALALLSHPIPVQANRAEQMLSRPLRRRSRDEQPSAGDYASIIKRVNRAVNDLPLTDCKAFTYEKLRRLDNLGIKGRFMVVTTETGGYHAIAVVGEMALDNRQKFVMTLDELRGLGYRITALN